MFLTGFADEASPDLSEQIRVTKSLGWKFIEARTINGKMLGTMSDAEFDDVCAQLAGSGVSINCYGSAVANWSRHPRKDEDFEASRQELLTAIPRMKKLGITLLRGMSFLVPDDETPDSPELEAIIFKKVQELVRICEDNGILYGHENCMNYGGMSHVHTLRLLDHVRSDSFRLILDTGNPVFNYRRLGDKPYPYQSSWEFYRMVREFVVYVHIKDGVVMMDRVTGETTPRFTWAGDGCGDVRAIVTDLLKNGYDGGFSMEPHMASVFHDKKAGSEIADASAGYIEYGRRFEKLLRECGWTF